MSHQQNIQRIKMVHDALEEIADQVVFVGGATVSLYVDRPAAEVRPTDDVDILVEVIGYQAYAAIEKKLRAKGFANDTSSNVICRYTVNGVTVDVMPTDENILGFSNRWYQEAFVTAAPFSIDNNYTIRIPKPELFVATKLEAFKGRGNNERTSSDFEDLVHIFNNRTTIWQEIEQANLSIGTYLKATLSDLLNNKYFEEWVSAHLEFHEQRRINFILDKLQSLITAKALPLHPN